MNTQEHRDCFGTMFPDDLHLQDNVPNKGKVFTVRVKAAGGMIRSGRSIDTDIE